MTTLAVASFVVLLVTWVVYPFAITFLARRRRPETICEAAEWPSVTVIVATREAVELIHARVADCLAADYPADRLEVVVALDDACGFSTDALRFGDPRARAVRGDAPGGKPCALNAGARAARGKLLVFTDTHQRFEPSAIRHLVSRVSTGRYTMVSGMLELPRREGARTLLERYWAAETRLRRDETALHSAVGVSGSIYLIPRHLWLPLPAGLILDDLYLPLRLVLAGHRIGFAETALARDWRRSTPKQEYHRKVRTLTGIIQICAWLPRVLVPWRNPIWAQFLCHKLLRLLTPWLFIGLVVGSIGATVQRFGSMPVLGALTLASIALVIMASIRRGRAVQDAIHWFAVLQLAIVVATFNGLTGRWDVWRR